MYLNVNLAANSSSAAGPESSGQQAGSCTTPRTPEILNLLAGAPFDNVAGPFGGPAGGQAVAGNSVNNPSYFQPSTSAGITAAASTPGDGPSSPGEHASSSFSSFSSLCSSPTTPSTPPGSGIGSGGGGLPSIQNTRTYLIKEGLKLTIQSKRLASGRSSLEADHLLNTSLKNEASQLTTEDEERRRRRRERNKVAATKCRNRKKERTGILMQESDSLEDQNVSYRSEIQRLENEKRRLMDVLAMHSPNCLKTSGQTPISTSSTEFIHHEISSSQQGSHFASMATTMSSPSYCQMPYDCRPSSDTVAMAAGGPTAAAHHLHHHHQQPIHSSYLDSVQDAPTEPNLNYSSGGDIGSYSQVNLVHRIQQSYASGDTNHPGPNYR